MIGSPIRSQALAINKGASQYLSSNVRYLRHPGRAIEPGEVPPAAMLAVLAAQTGCALDAFADYATRDTTLREHRAAIERLLGLRAFERADRAMVFATASEVAASTDRCDAMVERLRGAGVVLPLPAVLERAELPP